MHAHTHMQTHVTHRWTTGELHIVMSVTNVNKKGADVDIKGWSGKATLRRQHFNKDLKEDTGGRKKTRECLGRRRERKSVV